MEGNNLGRNIYAPQSLNELLHMREQHPDTILWSGGTALMRMQKGPVPSFDRDIIHLSGVNELKKIRRTERYLEIGAAVPVKKIINVGQHILPFALAQALMSIGSPAVRNLATMGGNLGIKDRRLNSFSVLMLMDSIVELRRSGKSRWIQLGRLNSIGEAEILTRIRIPFRNWDLQYFRAVGDPLLHPMDSLSFTVLAETNKGIISNLRFAVGNTGKSTLRSLDFETYLSGKKLRLSGKEFDAAVNIFQSFVQNAEGDLTPFQKDRSLRFVHWFLRELRDVYIFTE
ncbi:MAG: molybdopterin dehydrogenase [Spirochaetes bacterium]|nr:MAG: molybdopterin dehydrogenase [Spirochaetota bacterium]